MAKVIDGNPFERATAERLVGQVDYRALPRTRREVMAERVRCITTALLEGVSPDLDLVAWIREREADPASPFFVGVGDGSRPLSYAMCRRLVVRANDLIAKAAEGDREHLLAQHLAKRRRLYERAVQRGDVRAALAVLDSEANLLGLFPERAGLPGASGGMNLQILVQAVLAAESKTLEVKTLEMVPVEATATLIEESNGNGTKTGGKCRDEAVAVGSETLP
jgi:hypothetical protein